MEQELICPACVSQGAAKQYSIPDHEYNLKHRANYAECSQCQTLYQSPMPSFHDLASFYPSEYHSFIPDSFLTRVKNKMRLKHIQSYLDGEEVTILDYGCGGGSFIKAAAQWMPQAKFYGYEIADAHNVTKLMDGRVTIIQGSFDDLMNELPKIDLVTMNHVIEHLPDPQQTLEIFYEQLNPNGVIEGQTPASDSLEHKVFKSQWSGFHAPRHTVVFSKEGLKSIFERTKYREVSVKGAFNPAGIAVSLASMPHGDKPGRVVQEGFGWLFYLGLATMVYPFDLLSGQPGIIDFSARK